MESLIDALKDTLSDRISTEHTAMALERTRNGYRVHFDNSTSVEADIVVLSTPAHASAIIIKELDNSLSRELEKIPYPAVTVVCMGFRRESIDHPLDGFGFLIPHREGKRILGSLWDSSIFINRAPEQKVLLRSIVGGARASDLALLANEKIQDMVLTELSPLLGIRGAPELVKIYRHERGIPQYNLGHQDILRGIDTILRCYSGLYLHGNAYRGIGVNDCIEKAYDLTERIIHQHVEGRR